VYSASFVIGLAEFGDSNHYILRQLIWAVVGTVLLLAAAKTDYRKYRQFAVPIMLATIALLAAGLVFGIEGGGAKRWIGAGELTIQPSEFAKLTVIIYLAAWLSGKGGDTIRSFEHGLVPFVLIIGAVGALIMLEPNLGTTLIILLITVTMFWVAGASVLQMVALAAAGFVCVLFLATVEGYRMDRITAFLDTSPDPLGHSFQTLQSLIALGNGGLTGLGLGESRGKFFYIPASHTDGIFAIIGEEMGIVATGAIVLLYGLLMVRGYQVARRSRDEFGMLIATGITTWVMVQALLNLGGITRVIPLTGVPLPFISFGSNALAAIMLAMGLLLSISRYGNDRGGYMERDEDDRRIVRRQKR
jgi:cell division protein FtsW